MALSIGELVGFLRIDDKGVDEGLGSADGKLKKFGKAAAAAGAVAGGAAAAGLAVGMAGAMELDQATAKLEAQLGGTGPVSQQAGRVAGQLYASAYGENIGEVTEAVRAVAQNIGSMANASDGDLQRVTGRVMSLSQAFDQDLGQTTRAVDQMLRTGLAPSADAALDILAKGFQNGNNDADDLLDTMSEYSTEFRNVGLSGTQAMGLIQQGLQAGARDADTVADAIKEFGIRAADGSKTTAAGFDAIGLSAQEMSAQFQKGGPAAQAALQTTLDKLREMKDAGERDAAAVALFGTKAEDLQDALYALDPSTATAAMGDVAGAAERTDKALGDTVQSRVESLKRGFEQWQTSMVTAQGPLGTLATGVTAFGPDVLSAAGNLGMMAMAFRGSAIASGLLTAAQWLLNGAMSANPMALAVIALFALAAALVFAWNHSETFRAVVMRVWEITKAQISGAVDRIKAVLAWFNNLNTLANQWFGRFKDAAIAQAVGMISWLLGLPGRVVGALGPLGGVLTGSGRSLIMGLWEGAKAAFSWVTGQFRQALANIRRLFPFSPAKEGPFSGSGYTTHSGRAMARDLGAGLRAGIPDAMASARALMAGARSGLDGAALSGPMVRATGAADAVRGGDGASADAYADAVGRAVHSALHGARMEIDGRGVARLVNRRNARDAVRGAVG